MHGKFSPLFILARSRVFAEEEKRRAREREALSGEAEFPFENLNLLNFSGGKVCSNKA
jgi:hypothetical protein